MYKEMTIMNYGYPFVIGISYDIHPHGVEIIDTSVRSEKPDNVNDQEYYHTRQSFEYALKKGDYHAEIVDYILNGIPVLKEEIVHHNRNLACWFLALLFVLSTVILVIKSSVA